MLVSAVAFSDFVLAVHILAVVVGFGATFAYPLIFAAAFKADPKVVPWLFTTVRRIDRYIVNPGLTVVVICGIYLASDEHRWSAFFVQWGLGAAIVIGGVVGAFMIPREGKLAEIAERDLAAVGSGASAGASPWSEEFNKLYRQVTIGGTLLDLLVIVTIFLMATHAGGR
jgi:uncharacterized membrane protein